MGQFRPQFVCSLGRLGNRACGGDSLGLSFLVNCKSVEGQLIVDVGPEILKGLLATAKRDGWRMAQMKLIALFPQLSCF